MDYQKNEILLEILKEFPYFKKYSSGGSQKRHPGTYDLIDFTLDKIISTSMDILESAVFLYGDQSRFSDIIGASSRIKSLNKDSNIRESLSNQVSAFLDDYDETRFVIPKNSIIHYLNINKNPLLINLINYPKRSPKINSIIEFKKHKNSLSKNVITRNLLLNASLRDSSKVLYFYNNNLKYINILMAPLGLLNINESVPEEKLFEMKKYGSLTGYVIFYAKDKRLPDGSIDPSIINQFERAMQVLWIICNSFDEFHITKLERIARENFYSEITHQFNSGLYPLLSALESFKEEDFQEGWNTLKEVNFKGLYKFVEFLNSPIGENNITRFSIDKLIKSVIKETKSFFPDINLFFHGKGKNIYAYESEIIFCIYELINNARKYHSSCLIDLELFTEKDLNQKNDLEKSFRNKLDFEKQIYILKNFVCITIKNDGGIPNKYKETIFESRKRIINNNITIDKGTTPRGQGLYLIKKFIEQNHGGIVFEDGIPNNYARFRIILQT